MIAGVPAALACPLLAALLLALLPARIARRTLAAGSVAVSLLTLLLAVLALLSPGTGPNDGPGTATWLQDRLALSLPVALAVPACLIAWALVWAWASPKGRPGPDPAGRTRMMAVQLLTAGAIAACRADLLFVMLAAFVPIGLGATLLLPGHRRPGASAWIGALLLLAGLGAAMLSAGLGLPAGWSRLQAGIGAVDPSLRLFGRLLLLLPMLLLTWLAHALGPSAPDGGPEPATGRPPLPLLVPLLAIPALACVLRLRGLPEPVPALLRLHVALSTGGGVLILLFATLLLPARSGPAGRLSTVAGIQLGAAAIGFGIGGTVAIAGGLLMLASLTLGLPTALLPGGSAAATRTRQAAVLALAGLPPFGTFAGGFMLLMRLFGDQRLLALLVLAAFAVGAVSLLPLLRAQPMAAAAPGPPTLSIRLSPLPGLVVLALLAWLGVAMPIGLSDWLLGLAEGLAGPPWPAVIAP